MHGGGMLDAGLGNVYLLLHATGTCIYRSTQIGCNRRGRDRGRLSLWIGQDQRWGIIILRKYGIHSKENIRFDLRVSKAIGNTDYIGIVCIDS